MVRKPGYVIGDVVRLPLDVEGIHGYGRILRKERLGILVEFFRFASSLEPSIETLGSQDRILTIYCSDLGITQASWKVIGHLPVIGPAERLIFWHRSAITGKLYLRTHPDDVVSQRETTEEEIHRLRAQPSGLFGDKAAQAALAAELRRVGSLGLSPDSNAIRGERGPRGPVEPGSKSVSGPSVSLVGPNPALVRIRLETEGDLRRIQELEDELAREGVHFDTGYSLEEALREWHLDRVEGPMTREAILRRLADLGFDVAFDSSV